jgi:hypothetical protein
LSPAALAEKARDALARPSAVAPGPDPPAPASYPRRDQQELDRLIGQQQGKDQ